jgi:hypothetical protein
MNHRELIQQLYFEPLINDLLQRELLSGKELIEYVIYEDPEKEPEATEPPEGTETPPSEPEEKDPPKPEQVGTEITSKGNFLSRLGLPTQLAISAGAKILQIIPQIVNKTQIQEIETSGEFVAPEDADEELKKLALTLTAAKRKISQQIAIEGNKVIKGTLGNNSILHFLQVINKIKPEEYASICENPKGCPAVVTGGADFEYGNPKGLFDHKVTVTDSESLEAAKKEIMQQFQEVNSALKTVIQGGTPSISGDIAIGTQAGGETSYKLNNENLTRIVEFLRDINQDKNTIVDLLKKAIKGSGVVTVDVIPLFKEILTDDGRGDIEVPEDFTLDVYEILELLYPED